MALAASVTSAAAGVEAPSQAPPQKISCSWALSRTGPPGSLKVGVVPLPAGTPASGPPPVTRPPIRGRRTWSRGMTRGFSSGRGDVNRSPLPEPRHQPPPGARELDVLPPQAGSQDLLFHSDPPEIRGQRQDEKPRRGEPVAEGQAESEKRQQSPRIRGMAQPPIRAVHDHPMVAPHHHLPCE